MTTLKLTPVGRVWRGVVGTLDGIAAVCLAAMLALMLVEIGMRTFAGSSTLIADEYSGYALVALAFFGMAGAFRGGHHVRLSLGIDAVGKRSARGGAYVELICVIVVVAFVAVLLLYAGQMTWQSYSRGTLAATISRTPLWIPQLLMVIGLFAWLAEAIRRAVVIATAAVHGRAAPALGIERVEESWLE